MSTAEKYEPDDPREWLRHARSDLALASATIAGVDRTALCYHAQQAAEKAIKAVFIARNREYPFVHDLAVLLSELAADGVEVPESVEAAASLNRYAAGLRYPARAVVDAAEHEASVTMAHGVVTWAAALVARRLPRVGEPRRSTYAGTARGSESPSPELLADVVMRVVDAAAPERVVLFGSAARGTMHDHSDLDLLVVRDGEYDAAAMQQRIRAALAGLRVAFDIVIATPAELERFGTSLGLVYRPALREGVVLYQRMRAAKE